MVIDIMRYFTKIKISHGYRYHEIKYLMVIDTMRCLIKIKITHGYRYHEIFHQDQISHDYRYHEIFLMVIDIVRYLNKIKNSWL